jgi:predicted RNase H-like HicB family nuclease
MTEMPHYSILIKWSDEDSAFLIRLPEWEQAGIVLGPVTHGETYQEAFSNGQEALELLVEDLRESGETLPEPRVFAGVG